MPVIETKQDPQALTLTVDAEFAAPTERVWQLWADARQLERWWGPPTWPATFEQHELKPGGESRYFMTGPEGDRARGWWSVTEVEEPTRIEFLDGFSGDDGEPLDRADHTRNTVTFTGAGDRTRVRLVASFRDAAQMEQWSAMGMEEGITEAMNQVDGLLAAG